MRTKAIFFVALLALLSLPARAQEGSSEVSVNFTGNFQTQATGFGQSDTPSYSGGLLVNYRYHFNRWSAIEVNYGYTRFTHFYNSGEFTQANTNEATFAYLFTFGIPNEARLRPFLETGTGALFFSPVINGSSFGQVSQNRATLLYGGGFTYTLTRQISAQAGYRGLIYTDPDFTVPAQLTNATVHMAEPYAGLTFRF